MAEQVPTTRRDLEAQVIARAWKDEGFAQELRADPRAALARELGRMQPGATLPENLEIKVLEETPTTLYLVVPPRPQRGPTGPLTDEDLERAAGGGGCDFWDPRTSYD